MSSEGRGRSAATPSGAFLALAIAAVLGGLAYAWRLRWITDDAWISFRYAERLVQGLGLTFNNGERVEGYSNFLWTLWSAAGIAVGAHPAAWSIGWSLACSAGTLGLLIAFAWRRPGGAMLPIAAVLLAVHRDAAIFATSGLETALITLLAVAGFVLVLDAPGRPKRLAAAGLALALASLTRPDGVLFAAIAGVYVLAVSPRRLRDASIYAAPLLLVLVPFLAWKLAYYGDVFPNTYYAKSASRAWYSQGLAYAGLYFAKYWVLPLGAMACGLAAWRGRGRDENPKADPAAGAWNRAALLAAAFAVLYTIYVAHVGGDFMFARLLIPATPFWLILLQLAADRLLPARLPHHIATTGALALAMALTPYPFAGEGWVNGIVNEREFYSPRERQRGVEFGIRLRELFDGLPLRVAFCGGQAVLAYHSRAPIAIETATGLTDSTIAHQPIERRGRVGHEKKTPIPYLIARGTHFWMYSGSLLSDSLATYIPLVPLQLDTLTVMAVTWDPPVMDALRARGAKVPDFLATLDEFIAVMPAMSEAEVRSVYEKTRRFYFDHVSDPMREGAFRTRLGRPGR